MSKLEFKMPKLGESITEAAIITWFKNVGDSIEVDEMLLEVATDKVDSEVPSTVSGVIKELLFEANDVIKIGATIAIIEVDNSEKSNKNPETKSAIKTPEKEKPIKVSKSKTTYVTSNQFNVQNSNLFFSPLVIEIAKTHHISFEELARIPATGNEGRLRKSDVFQYIEEGRPYKFAQPLTQDPTAYRIPQLTFDKGKGKIVEMDRMRQMIADHMVYSKHTSPHVTAYVEADLTNMVNWRNANKKSFQDKYGERLTFTPLFVEAVAKAIKDFPNIKASVDGTNIIVKKDINIGMAAALPSGNLIVPVIKNADQLNLMGMTKRVNDLAVRARNNQLSPDDIQDGTYTVTNVGGFGSIMGTPIINQPQVGILALGAIRKVPAVIETSEGDFIGIRQKMFLSHSYDHRVVNGALGGQFLKTVKELLESWDENRQV